MIDMRIEEILQGIEEDYKDKDHFSELKALDFFSELFKKHGYNPIISIYFLLFIQLIKDPVLLKQYESYDLKRLYVKLNGFIIRLGENLEDCLYYLDLENTDQQEINIQKQKLKELTNTINSKILEFEKWQG
jgi:hypothetical protein